MSAAYQPSLAFSGGRRIDLTIERLDRMVEELPQDERERLAGPAWSWWSIVVTVARLRAMERAEIEVLGQRPETMADAYDRVVQPGEHAVGAMIKTFKEVYANPMP